MPWGVERKRVLLDRGGFAVGVICLTQSRVFHNLTCHGFCRTLAIESGQPENADARSSAEGGSLCAMTGAG
jgi:hypothetical protein